MPIKKIIVPPGIDRESTQQTAGPNWYDGNNVRWRDRNTQTIGGWEEDGVYSLKGFGRGMHAWQDFNGNVYQCVGTHQKFYLISGTSTVDITPARATQTGLTDPIETTSGSSLLIVNDASHGAALNDFVVFTQHSDADSGGIDDSVFLDAHEGFQIYEIIDDDSYRIDVGTNASATDATAGGTVTILYKISSGSLSNATGQGFGVGPWGGDDFVPTVYALASPYVTTVTGSNQITFDTNGAYTFAVDGDATDDDWIYPYGLVGSAGTLDTGFLNNKWWKVTSISGGGDAVITFDYLVTTGGTGGTSGSFYAYDETDSQVEGATRGWGTPSTESVTVNQLRTLSISNFGEDLIFSNRGGPLYYYDVSTHVSVGVPQEASLAVEIDDTTITGATATPDIVDSFIVAPGHNHTIAFGANDIGSSTQNKMLIRWSDRNNPFVWLPNASNEAGGEVLRSGSDILKGVSTKDEIVVFTNSSVYSMRYVGYPVVYGLTLITENVSMYSRDSAVAVDNNVYFMGNDQFYVYNGTVTPLSKSLVSYVFDTINESQRGKVFAGVNSKFTEVVWVYPEGTSFEPNRWVAYNYANGTWSMGVWDMTALSASSGGTTGYGRTTWQDSSVFSNPIASFVKEYDPSTSPVTSTSSLMIHESGVSAQGNAISHHVESGEVDLSDGEFYAYYNRLIPDIEIFNQGSGAVPTITASLQGRDLPGRNQNAATSTSIEFTPVSDTDQNYAPNHNQTGVSGRSRTVSLKISSEESGFGWRLGDTRVHFKNDGKD